MNRLSVLRNAVLGIPLLLLLSGCMTLRDHGELNDPGYVELDQILDEWFVQGYLPTAVDGHAYDATYEFDQRRDGTLRVVYSFNHGAHDGPVRIYEFKAEIDNPQTNADWTLQLMWPFESDFRIIYVSPDYSSMLVGHPSRKYLYILSKSRDLSDRAYQWLLDFAASQGFDTSFVRRVPHQG